MAILAASTNIRGEEGVNTGIILWVTSFSLATRDLELWCAITILHFVYIYIHIYMYRYNTVLVNKFGGFHMADRGTELRTLFPPQTCLVNSSFCYFYFVFPNFHHAAILFPSSQELFMFYVHIHRGLISHSSRQSVKCPTVVRTKWKDTWKIKIQKILKSCMLCDDGIKYSKRLMKYPDSHPFLICGTGKSHIGRKTEHTRAG